MNHAPTRQVDPGEGRSVGGAVLALLRAYRRVSQKGLARQTGVHHAAISRYERGERPLSEADRQRILDGLELPERAWEAVESMVEWLDWLSKRHELRAEGVAERGGGAPGREEAGHQDLSNPVARRREADRLAETAGRALQRQLAEMLDFFIALGP